MGLKSYVPYAGDYKVRKQIDKLFSREVLGAVIVGKFFGDYTAILMRRQFGTDFGYILGIIGSTAIFVYWEYLSAAAKEATEGAKDKAEEAKDKVKKDEEN